MNSSHELYLSMKTVRSRLDLVEELKLGSANEFLRAESAAFHGRKIVEAIAFGCLVAIENGLGHNSKRRQRAMERRIDPPALKEERVVSSAKPESHPCGNSS